MVTMMLFGPFWTKFEDMEWWGKKLPWFIGIGLLITLVLFVFSGGIELFGTVIPPNLWIPGLTGEDVTLILLLLLTGVIIFAVQGETPAEEKKPKDKMG